MLMVVSISHGELVVECFFLKGDILIVGNPFYCQLLKLPTEIPNKYIAILPSTNYILPIIGSFVYFLGFVHGNGLRDFPIRNLLS